MRMRPAGRDTPTRQPRRGLRDGRVYGMCNYLSDTTFVPFRPLRRQMQTYQLLAGIAPEFSYSQAPFSGMEMHRPSRPSLPVLFYPQHPWMSLYEQAVALVGISRNTHRDACTTSKTTPSSRTASNDRQYWNEQTRTTSWYRAPRLVVTAAYYTLSALLGWYRRILSPGCRPISASRGLKLSYSAPPMAL